MKKTDWLIFLVLLSVVGLGALEIFNVPHNSFPTAPLVTPAVPTAWEDGPHCAPNGLLYERSTKVLPNGIILYQEWLVLDINNIPAPCDEVE